MGVGNDWRAGQTWYSVLNIEDASVTSTEVMATVSVARGCRLSPGAEVQLVFCGGVHTPAGGNGHPQTLAQLGQVSVIPASSSRHLIYSLHFGARRNNN